MPEERRASGVMERGYIKWRGEEREGIGFGGIGAGARTLMFQGVLKGFAMKEPPRSCGGTCQDEKMRLLRAISFENRGYIGLKKGCSRVKMGVIFFCYELELKFQQ